MTFYNKLSNLTKVKENHERFENLAAITLSSCKKLANKQQTLDSLFRVSSEKRGK